MTEEQYKWMVTVRCYTFNHSKYITDALNGFVMQQTNFPFVILLVDDASTDGEQEVIRNFVNEQFAVEDNDMAYEKEYENYYLSYAQHKTNKNCYIAVFYLKVNHYSNPQLKGKKKEYLSEWRDNAKYEALCEGDDYWIDPLKLQKQVVFLESHPDYSFAWSDAYTLNQKGKLKQYKRYKQSTTPPLSDIIIEGGLWVPTASILIKKEIFQSLPKERFHVGDYVLQIWGAYNGKNYYESTPTCVYRLSVAGSWTSQQKGSSKEGKLKIIEKEHYLLEKMDEYTRFEYHEHFIQRWHIYAFNSFIDLEDYKEAQRHWKELLPKHRRGLINKCYGNGYVTLGVFLRIIRKIIRNVIW